MVKLRAILLRAVLVEPLLRVQIKLFYKNPL